MFDKWCYFLHGRPPWMNKHVTLINKDYFLKITVMSINQFTQLLLIDRQRVNRVEMPDKNYQGQMCNLTLKAG